MLSYLKSASLNLSCCKVWCKNKNPQIWDQNAWFGYLWSGIWTWYCYIWNRRTRICVIAKICEKVKMSKFGTKNDLLWYFWAIISKNYCHIWNQHSRTCLTPKFSEKTKMPKFGIKYVWNQHPWICLVAKVYKKQQQKKHKFGTKNALFGYFWTRNLKKYCHIWDQHPWVCQKWIFNPNQTVNFGIGPAFSKDPGSAFSEGTGPGPGPLYKVCHYKVNDLFYTEILFWRKNLF